MAIDPDVQVLLDAMQSELDALTLLVGNLPQVEPIKAFQLKETYTDGSFSTWELVP